MKYQMVAKNCSISLQWQVKRAEPTLVEKARPSEAFVRSNAFLILVEERL